MATPGAKSPLEEYLDDLWETCDFPRPRQPSAAMKEARMQAAKEKEVQKTCDESINGDNYIDQLDPRHYRYVTEEIRKIRAVRASDRNIEWILGRDEASTSHSPKKTKEIKTTPTEMQSVKLVSPSEYQLPLPTEPRINVRSQREFPTLK